MNIFRLIADMLHLAAILILLYRIRKSRNCIGKLPHPHSIIISHSYSTLEKLSILITNTY